MAATSRQPEPGPERGDWRALVMTVSGLFLLCVAFLFIRPTERAIVLWLNRDRYVLTELEITDLSPGSGDSNTTIFGRIASTGEEIHTDELPPGLSKFDSPTDMTGELMTREEAIGQRFPVWYSSQARWGFSD